MDVGRNVEAGNPGCHHWQSVGEGKAGWLAVLINNVPCRYAREPGFCGDAACQRQEVQSKEWRSERTV